LGATFTINANGVYAIAYTDQFSAADSYFGLSLNTTTVGTDINAIAASEALQVGINPGGNRVLPALATVYLSAGDVVRAHSSGVSSGANPQDCRFTITRVA